MKMYMINSLQNKYCELFSYEIVQALTFESFKSKILRKNGQEIYAANEFLFLTMKDAVEYIKEMTEGAA